MSNWLDLLQTLVPEAMEMLKTRYEILNAIECFQPIGRRALAEKVGLSERILRRELDFLHSHGYLSVSTSGVLLTDKALELMGQAQLVVREAYGLTLMERELEKRLGLTKAIIVPGDYDNDDSVVYNMGRAAATLIKETLKSDSTIAVMGGWTVARVADMVSGHYPDVMVVPARGGLDEEVEIQANTVASKLAEKLGGKYKMLHLPENLDPKALEALLLDKRIRDAVNTIRNADILLYGIGRADVMARRRGLSSLNVARLLTKGAVAEALGNYYDENGQVIDKAPSLGIEITDQPNLALSVAIAGGREKVLAIVAALRNSNGQILVTDQGTAPEILANIK
ncbi:sugar-binding transcriptional regulator [Dethiobacter alkaliphilus]|uniref:sugar-binding transcriptional regulator n=1 Tax=Dethiobacter alkaliphilus TaxID=427926 RepID=UPI002226660D|nr:sugar-binding domain-containing protein [Dethiobacter alkaliphilus]MCW3489985.1 sugar-binding transcriptional regulator [Dethiobacter alkaliphilus]